MIYKQIQRINMFQSNLPSLLSFLSQHTQLVFIMTGWTSADVGTVASRWSKSEQRGYVPTTPGPHRHAMYTPWNPPDAWHPHKQNETVQTQESQRLCFCVQVVRRVVRFFPDQLCISRLCKYVAIKRVEMAPSYVVSR